MKHTRIRPFSLFGLVLWLLLATASPALAHAALLSSTIRDGDTFATAPDTATFTFSETVTLPRDAARLFDASASRVSGVFAEVDGPQVVVTLPRVPTGAYLLTLAVVSQDGHEVVTPVRFVVGDGTQLDDDATRELVSLATADSTWPFVTAVRALAYVAAFVVFGFVWLGRRMLPDGLYGQARRTVARCAWLGATAAVAGAALVGVRLYEVNSVFDLLAFFTADATRGFLLRGVAFVLVVLTLGMAGASQVAAATLMAGFVFDGHQLSMGVRWLMLAGDTAHLFAGGVWFGGVWLLWWLWRHDRNHTTHALARFSSVAALAAGVTVVAGAVMASQLLDGPGALVTTTYGRVLTAKLVVVGAVGVLAWRLRRVATHTTELPGVFGSWLRVDVAMFVAVLLSTAVLVGVNPQADTQMLLAQRTAIGDATLEVVVEPSVDSMRVVHAYVIDDAGELAAISELNVQVAYTALDGSVIGPFALDMAWVSDGHFLSVTDLLGFAGSWEFVVEAPKDRFTVDTATLFVDVP